MTLRHQSAGDLRRMKLLTRLTLWALKTSKIRGEDKTLILNALCENLGVLPIKDAISTNPQGQVLIRGKLLTDVDQANAIKQGASAMMDNGTRRLVKEQLMTEAGKIMLYMGKTPEDILFAKAIVWVALTEDKIYNDLAK